MDVELQRVFDRAVAAGVTLFDTGERCTRLRLGHAPAPPSCQPDRWQPP